MYVKYNNKKHSNLHVFSYLINITLMQNQRFLKMFTAKEVINAVNLKNKN